MPSKIAPIQPDDDYFDDDGWLDMPIIREDTIKGGLDEEDQKKYHYRPTNKLLDDEQNTRAGSKAGNATGNLLDTDDWGNEWRSKVDQNESDYTRLRGIEEDEADEVHLRTRYLFDEDKAMTPLSQMQATKDMLTEAQRIAYVGVCHLTMREMAQTLRIVKRKELNASVQNLELWSLKIMGRLYYHMELATQEQKMIESLADHGVLASDLVPALMTTRTVDNPEYDPAEAHRVAESNEPDTPDEDPPETPTTADSVKSSDSPKATFQTTQRVLNETTVPSEQIQGVTTSLSTANKDITLDIRWTILCDLFLILIADSVYDARSRVLLEKVALGLGLGWLDVVKFESRVTEALEIQEGVESMENQTVIEGRQKANRNKRIMMVGLVTLGGGLVIGLSAGLLAPVIGAGLGAAFTTIGIGGTTGFLAGAGGAAVITTGGVLTGSGIAAKGMMNRTQQVRTFQVLPLHNNKRVSAILTVPGFLNGIHDDPRLPYSTLDPVVGDVFSVLWEPEMIRETGSALKILTGEVLSQLGQTVLQATVLTALMGALQWPIILTKLGYLIDNPWNNALDRARAAGGVLAEVLSTRSLGVRPITLVGFSLGARVIFYALAELARKKIFGVVQDVFLLGATVTASSKTWLEVRSVVSGRFVNAYARNDWVLNYLFRATSGGMSAVAGLRPITDVPGLENVDVTDKIAGHMSYRTFMPLILDQLGFPVFADHFDEPEEPEFTEDRIVVREGEDIKKKGWFGSRSKSQTATPAKVSRPPSTATFAPPRNAKAGAGESDEMPPRVGEEDSAEANNGETNASTSSLPLHAGFDLSAMKEMISQAQAENRPELTRTVSEPALPSPAPVTAASDVDSVTLTAEATPIHLPPPPSASSSSPLPSPRRPETPRALPPVPVDEGEEENESEPVWQSGPSHHSHQHTRSFTERERSLGFGNSTPRIDVPSTRDPFVSVNEYTDEEGIGVGFGSSSTSTGADLMKLPELPDKSPGFSNPWS